MINVLNITGILPVSDLQNKKDENSIIVDSQDALLSYHTDLVFQNVFVLPYTVKLLSYVSKKWNSYYKLQRKRSFRLGDRIIYVIGIIMVPKKLPFRNVLYELSFLLNRNRLHEIVTKFNPSVVHAQNVDADAYLARKIKAKYGIPYVVTLRGINVVSDAIVADNLNSAERVIALSPVQEALASPITATDICFLPHGVPEGFFNTKKGVNTDTTGVRIVTVCRLLPLKNIDLIIRSLCRLSHDFLFDIYGDGPERENLQTLIHKVGLSGKVTLKGSIPNHELPAMLAGYDLFVMPSHPETLGRVYFEAMACGLPVVAAKGTGVDGIVTDGREGFLVDLHDPDALKNILSRVFDGPEMLIEMGNNAKQLAGKYKWDSICREMYSVYSKSAKRNG